MKTRNELLVLAGLMLAWVGVASAELTLSWTGERQSVARASVPGKNKSAADKAANYDGGTDWMDNNGGSGFAAWQEKLSDGASVDRTVGVGANEGFTMQATAAGEIAMVRPLETAQGLESGTFSVTMWGAMGGADELVDFAGFAVYGSGDNELFRWGFRQDGVSEGLAVSLDGGANYTPVSSFYPLNGVDYIVTWTLMGETTQFTLSAVLGGDAKKEESDWTYYYNGSQDEDHMPQSLGTSERVMAIAAILTESGTAMTGGDGSEMTFDNMRVTGEEPTPAVPEPGVLGLLAAGAAALWRKRKMHNA